MASVKLVVRIERKQAELPAFVVVPADAVAKWTLAGTTTVEGTVDGVSLGRRSLKRWDDERWFLELRRDTLEALGKAPGARVTLVLRLASTDLPEELRALLETSAVACKRWEARTEAQKRMLREDIQAVKSSAARERRARKALLPTVTPEPRPEPVKGLDAEPRSLRVRILAQRLPGRTCGPYSEIAVCLVASKGGCDPAAWVSAEAREATWETHLEVRGQGGAPRFRGPAVNGPPNERFLYLTWIGRKSGAAPAMFRRAKLRLDAVPSDVLAKSLRSGLLVGRLGLTAADGMPVCASVRPPAITWSSA